MSESPESRLHPPPDSSSIKAGDQKVVIVDRASWWTTLSGWMIALIFACLTGVVALYFLQRENDLLRAELERATNSRATVAITPPTNNPPAIGTPRWLPEDPSSPPPSTLPPPKPEQELPIEASGTVTSPKESPEAFHPPGPTVRTELKGRVLDQAGSPVSNAEILVFPQGGNGTGSPLLTRSGSDGAFVVQDIPGEVAEIVTVRAEGFGSVDTPDVPLPLDDLEIYLDRLMGLDVRVLRWNGGQPTPLEGLVTLFLLRQSGKEHGDGFQEGSENPAGSSGGFLVVSSDAVTLREGRWRSNALEPGLYKVGVALEGEYAESPPQRLDQVQGGEVLITLGLRQRLRGEVRSDPDQNLIPGAGVELLMTSRPSLAGPAAPLATKTDDKGQFILSDVPPGTYQITLTSDLHTTKVLRNIPVTAGPEPEPAVFFMSQQSPSLSLLVLNPQGQPVASAPVTITAPRAGQSGPWFGTTDDDGRFKIDNLQPGRYTVSVVLPMGRGRQTTAESTALPLGRGRQKLIEITLEERRNEERVVSFQTPLEVRGRILRGDEPYEGQIRLRPRDLVVSQEVFKTDAQGLFSELIEPGDWILEAAQGEGAVLLQVRETMAQPVELRLE